MIKEARPEKIDELVKILKDEYRDGLALALTGRGVEIEIYLNRMSSVHSFATSMMISGYINHHGLKAIDDMLENLRLMILSNNSEKYDSKNGLIDSELFEQKVREHILEIA